MDNAEQKNIRLVVDDEQKLYTPFSPEDEFNEPVKAYIRSKIAGKDDYQSISLTVMSRDLLNEEKFRSAVSNWIRDEKAMFQKTGKDLMRMLVGLLIVGSILIVLSLALEKQVEVLKYSLLPVMGSLSLSRAAGIMVLKLPTNTANKRRINEMEQNSVITFEYGYEQNTEDNTP